MNDKNKTNLRGNGLSAMTKRASAALVLAVLMVMTCVIPAMALDTKSADLALVRVLTSYGKKMIGSGTGFVINDDGFIVTNEHVVSEKGLAKGMEVYVFAYRDNVLKKIPAQVINTFHELDLAILKVENLKIKPLSLLATDAEPGLKVYAAGFPGGADLTRPLETTSPTFSDGVVSNTSQRNWGNKNAIQTFPIIQHSAPISGGNSGGPILDDCNIAIGVNTLRNVSVEGIYFSLGSTKVIEVLESLNIKHSTVSSPCSISAVVAQATGVSSSSSNIIMIGVAALAAVGLGVSLFVLFGKKKAVAKSGQASASGAPQSASSFRDPQYLAARPVQQSHPTGRQWKMSGYTASGDYQKIYLDESHLQTSHEGYIIGRKDGGAHLVLNSPKVSRRHVRVFGNKGQIFMEDLGSANGTWLNGTRLQSGTQHPITKGDKIRLADVQLILKPRAGN